jgi:8-amino-7-oxononanoate synthase
MDFAMETPLGPRVVIAGRERDYFSGTGYLGLHNHPVVQQAAIDCITRYGMSTATSRGGYGEHPVYAALERELCDFFDAGRALVFSSGYLGAAILCQVLADEHARIFVDAWSHFSVFDAARGTGLPVHTFEHLDPAALTSALRRELRPGERPLVLSDGLFPISGELAPLPDLLAAVEPYHGKVILDDAHAAGAVGPHGRGTADYYGIPSSDCLASSATLSKALGGFGGILCGSQEQMERIEQHSKIPVAASPPPLPAAAASAAAVHLARTQPQLRTQLAQNVLLARTGLRALGWPLPDSPAPILCLGVRPGLDLGRIKDGLFEQGICVSHVRTYSSTPPGGALRVAIFANHTSEQIDHLLAALAKLI